jgi:glycosyltransferase involved in cell wall biosynthesis
MRIVYVLTSLGIGGAERQVLALGERMAQRGHTVVLLVLRPQLDEEWPTRLDVFHLNIRKTPLSVLQGMKRGRRFLHEFRPDIVHSHGFHGNLIARLFRRYAAAPPPISTIHNVYEGGWARMLAYRFTDRLSALTTAVSQAAAERFVRMKAVPRSKCMVLSNGIDTELFAADAERRERVRSEMAVDGEFVWLAAGRIVPAKDYPNLLRAFALLRELRNAGSGSVCSDPGFKLWIAGEGDDNETDRSQRLTRELGLENAVRWLGLRRDLPALLDAADGFVLGSAWEGMPLAVGEAMAMERPVVATDVGGTGELIGEAGILVPAKDSRALAEAMLAIMRQSANERREMGRRARIRICQHFSLDAKADEWEALYNRVLHGPAGGILA